MRVQNAPTLTKIDEDLPVNEVVPAFYNGGTASLNKHEFDAYGCK